MAVSRRAFVESSLTLAAAARAGGPPAAGKVADAAADPRWWMRNREVMPAAAIHRG